MDNDIKKPWTDAVIAGHAFNPQQITTGQHVTALQNLARRYRRFSVVALLCILWVPLTAVSNYTCPMVLKIVWMAISAAFFLTCAIMDNYLYRKISAIDVYNMTVDEVWRMAARCRKRHLQCVAVLLPWALLLVGLLIMMAGADEWAVYAIAGGVCIGLCIGGFQLIRFLNDYQRLMR